MINRRAYPLALALAAGTTLFLLFGIGALGVIGSEGERADMMFLPVIALALVGAAVTRLRPEGMVVTMSATAAATMVVGIVALALGKHQSEHSSVLEILGLTGMYASLFAASAWQFRLAAQKWSTAPNR